jgi:N-acetylglucosaminyl-diphospho-decaprenol L-rhamnosyltransferase
MAFQQISERTTPLRVVAIIVSYKTARLVQNACRSLFEERERLVAHGIDLRCCVIDNASGDAATLAPFFDAQGWGGWLDLIIAERNGGFAYGNNVAFKHAFDAGYAPDYFFLLNPDAEVRPLAVAKLVEFLEATPGAGTAGSSLETETGELWPYAFRFPNIIAEGVTPLGVRVVERLFEKKLVARPMGEQVEEVDWYPGAAMMCRSRIIRELGGMDESYFLYYEETDFCLKLKRAGWSHWYVPASRVMHIAGQSTGVTGADAEARPLPGYWYESRRRYFQKNHGLGYALAADAAAILGQAVGGLQRLARGKGQSKPLLPQLRDFFNGSTLRPTNRNLKRTEEFRPGT